MILFSFTRADEHVLKIRDRMFMHFIRNVWSRLVSSRFRNFSLPY